MSKPQLRGYIPPSAPLNWEPVTGEEPPLRVGVSFTVRWFRERAGVDYSERYHIDPEYRYETLKKMKGHILKSFPGAAYFWEHGEGEYATLSSVFGVCFVAMVYGLKPIYFADNWPAISPDEHLSVEQIKNLKPFDLINNPVVEQVFEQMDIIKRNWGVIDGYLNYQGVLNNAFKIRGTDIFMDMFDDPGFAHYLFEHITETMIALIQMIQKEQRESGFYIDSMSTSNCVVNMISPEVYEEFVLPYDIRLSKSFERFGIHSCNWVVDPYIDLFNRVENLGYVDFGSESDLEKIGRVFTGARKHVFYSASHLIGKSPDEWEWDVTRMCETLGPCDLSVPDIDLAIPDENIIRFIEIAEKVANAILYDHRDWRNLL
ncbi:MAG: hypothetical protein FWH55_06595 [Oscillospiraceae bacterium]|nr:hypothetical protein [Oscillospiraceae bacterium]